jgi:hemoglobin
MSEDMIDVHTPYAQLGGEPAIRRLVARFYALMDALPEAYTVRQIHPDDLSGAQQSLFEFLSGWFGGPQLYMERHGHPRLRMRHAPYRIGTTERDEWMLCMRQALSEEVADSDLRAGLLKAFGDMATHIINTDGREACTAPHD